MDEKQLSNLIESINLLCINLSNFQIQQKKRDETILDKLKCIKHSSKNIYGRCELCENLYEREMFKDFEMYNNLCIVCEKNIQTDIHFIIKDKTKTYLEMPQEIVEYGLKYHTVDEIIKYINEVGEMSNKFNDSFIKQLFNKHNIDTIIKYISNYDFLKK